MLTKTASSGAGAILFIQQLRSPDAYHRFSNIFWFLVPISRGAKIRFAPSADTYEGSPPYLLKNKMSLKKFHVIWQPCLSEILVLLFQSYSSLCQFISCKVLFYSSTF